MRASIAFSTALVTFASLAGCASEADSDAEEDAAAASSDGKSDGSSFALGPYMTWSYEDGKPLLAHFHARTGNEPAGETGFVDYVTFSEDEFEAKYTSGSFKVYQWRGRDRLRITDADGDVVLRSDWSYTDGKLTFGGIELTQPRMLPEELVDCLAFEIKDYGWFEEGLTQWEYPSVSIDKEGTAYSLQIGGSSYTADEGTIAVNQSAASIEGVATLDGYKVSIRVPNAAPRRGQIVVQNDGEPEQLIANIVCR